MHYIKRRLFVGIHLSPALQKRLAQQIAKWGDDIIIPTRQENLHITLSFLGFIQEDQIPDICQRLEEAVATLDVFDVDFDAITIMDSMENPKHIWLTGPANEPLRLLQGAVEKAMGTFVTERKTYRPHVTLAKIKKAKWLRAAEAGNAVLPKVDMCLRLSDPVDTITLFESTVLNGKRLYDPLAVFPLGDE